MKCHYFELSISFCVKFFEKCQLKETFFLKISIPQFSQHNWNSYKDISTNTAGFLFKNEIIIFHTVRRTP